MNKITQKVLGYVATIALCLGGAGYFGYKASQEPSAPKQIKYIEAIDNALAWGGLGDNSIKKILDKNKIMFDKAKEDPELASDLNNLEKILSGLPSEYLTSTEDSLYNQTKEIIQRELQKIRDKYPSEKGKYTGAAIALGILAPTIAGVGYLDISNKKREEKESKRYFPELEKSNSDRLIGTVRLRKR